MQAHALFMYFFFAQEKESARNVTLLVIVLIGERGQPSLSPWQIDVWKNDVTSWHGILCSNIVARWVIEMIDQIVL